MGFIKLLFRLCLRIFIYAIIFMLFVWVLLGIKPMETWQRSIHNIVQIGDRLSRGIGVTVQTVDSMKNVAESQLQKASDRIDGKDPYEDFSKRLDEQVRKDIQ